MIITGNPHGVCNILDYGARCDDDIANDCAIHRAVAAMQPGDTLLIPPGTFRIQNLVLDMPDDCGIVCLGTLRQACDAGGVAIQLGSLTRSRRRYRVQGLGVYTDGSYNWAPGRIGILAANLYEAVLDLRRVSGFEDNILFRGTAGQGCVYNQVNIGLNQDGKRLLRLTADNAGWCNENVFNGGRFDYTSSVTDDDAVGATAIQIDDCTGQPINNNRFMNNSLEGRKAGETIPAARISGCYNLIFRPRWEWMGPIILEDCSQWCSVLLGFGVLENTVDDRGSRNTVWNGNQLIVRGSTSDPDKGVIEAANQFGGNSPVFVVRDASPDRVRKFHVTGFGVVYSASHGYFQNGIRWSTSDGTMTDKGLFVGNGSPQGVVTAGPGSLYTNRSGGAGQTLWVKESGAGNTGWLAK